MKSYVQYQLKLSLRPTQERMLNRWLWHLTGVWNWAIRKIEADARDGRYWSAFDMKQLLTFHSKKMGIAAHTMHRTAVDAWEAWDRCFRGLARRPRLKGRRNRLSHIGFPSTIPNPKGRSILLRGIGYVRFHHQELPEGMIKCGRLVKRASGWYLCLMIDAAPQPIPITGDSAVGVDPGFYSLLTLSTGERIERPTEWAASAERLAQAQRGNRRQLTSRLLERTANQRKDRNHKLSRRLVSGHALIAWSKDCYRTFSRRFGKSVVSAAHGQLVRMLAYKCRTGGREFIEVPGRYSTLTCSACSARSGPTGYSGLKVRQWVCGACGAHHDRDVNAAINTLTAARGLRVERLGDKSSGIAA